MDQLVNYATSCFQITSSLPMQSAPGTSLPTAADTLRGHDIQMPQHRASAGGEHKIRQQIVRLLDLIADLAVSLRKSEGACSDIRQL